MIDIKYMFVIRGHFLILEEGMGLGDNPHNLPELFSTKESLLRKLTLYSDFAVFTRSDSYYLFKNRYNGQPETFNDINSVLNYFDDLPFEYITKNKYLKGWYNAIELLHSLDAF